MQSCVHSFFFFCPTDRHTFTRGRAMGNETFYWDGLNENTTFSAGFICPYKGVAVKLNFTVAN